MTGCPLGPVSELAEQLSFWVSGEHRERWESV